MTTTTKRHRKPKPTPKPVCGKSNLNLIRLGFPHTTCNREPGHDGFCVFEIL